MVAGHKSAAWPLALVYGALIVYASLFPFAGWRDQDIVPWLFLTAPWPRYWTWFDLVANVLGYGPMGFLLSLALLRSGHLRWAVRVSVLSCAMLSLTLETLQVYLPGRVPSNVDLALNIAGGVGGAMAAGALARLGALDQWSRWRADWFIGEARGAMVLLALWPLALLFPLVVPFGLGQVLQRISAWVAGLLADTALAPWMPKQAQVLEPLSPVAESLIVMLGLLVPVLLSFCVLRDFAKRIWLLLTVVLGGLAVTALSATLSFGPVRAWAWLNTPARAATLGALLVSVMLLWLPRRVCASLALLCLGVYLSLINQMPADAYFEQALFAWEQGRFIRFHGLAQWLGWLWPYAALVYVMSLLWSKESHP
jgi:VanZ family protein